MGRIRCISRIRYVVGAIAVIGASFVGVQPPAFASHLPIDSEVIKTDSPDPVLAGENLTYTIKVSNLSPGNGTTGVGTLTDDIPANTTFVSLSGGPFPFSHSCNSLSPGSAGGTVTCNGRLGDPNLGQADVVTFTLVVKVDEGVPDGTKITNTAKFDVVNDPNLANNTSTTKTNVQAGAATSTLTTHASPSVPLGGDIFDEATVSNFVPGATTGAVIFRLFGPDDASCSEPTVFTSRVSIGSDGTATSESFTPTAEGTYRWVANFTGDANNPPISRTDCNDPAESVIVTPGAPPATLTTQASAPTVAVGTPIFDTATLSPFTPSFLATMKFKLYGPDDSDCSGTPVSSSVVTVQDGGTAQSHSFTPLAAGVYRWVANFPGDNVNLPVGPTDCDDPAEQTVVTSAPKATPVLTTTASPRVTIGGAIFDTAHLTGGNEPTGTIQFKLYGPLDFNCTKAPVGESSTVVDGNGDYTSTPITPTAVGTYRFTATYSGDDANKAVGPTSCFDLSETTFVDKAKPTLDTDASPSVPLGGKVHDVATLAAGFNPTGTITFTLYGPDKCTGPPVFTSAPVMVSGNANYTSPDFTPAAAGTYNWRATYSGDDNNASVPVTGCPVPAEQVVVTTGPPPDQLTCSVQPAPPGGGPFIQCLITDADGVKRVTVKDIKSGSTTAEIKLSCRPPTTQVTFQYDVPTETQRVILVDCQGHRKILRVKPDGTVI